MSRREVQEMVVAGLAFYSRGRMKAGVFSLPIYRFRVGKTYRWSARSGKRSLPGGPAAFVMSGSIFGYPQATGQESGWGEREESRKKREAVEKES